MEEIWSKVRAVSSKVRAVWSKVRAVWGHSWRRFGAGAG